jgi:hypothetical protein
MPRVSARIWRINLAPYAVRSIYLARWSETHPCGSRDLAVDILESPAKNRRTCSYDEEHVGIIQIMMRKNLYFLPPVITSVLLLFPNLARAEFVCSAEVYYKWVKAAVSQSDEPARPKNGAGGEVVTPPHDRPGSSQAPSQVRFASVERGGGDEAAAKMALNIELGRQKARASEKCKRDHESFGECLATKLSVKATVLNSLSFSARSQLEQAITEECQAQQGTCMSVESSEPVCREVAKVEKAGVPTAQGSPAPDAKKADAAAKDAEVPTSEAKGSAKSDAKGTISAAKK